MHWQTREGSGGIPLRSPYPLPLHRHLRLASVHVALCT
jgi:hypothetical protein